MTGSHLEFFFMVDALYWCSGSIRAATSPSHQLPTNQNQNLMTTEKFINVLRYCKYSADQLRAQLRDMYDEELSTQTTPEMRMKRQALESLLREKQREQII